MAVAAVPRREQVQHGSGRPWSDERIARELADFARELGHTPSTGDFYDAGRVDLMSAIARRGGREKWLARLGLPPARPRPRRVPARRGPIPEQNRPRWTDETLERELRTFAAGRKFFPTTKEFLDAGKEDLQDAVKRYGGTIVWALRLGMPLRNGQDRRPYEADDAVADAKRALTEFGRLPDKDALRASGYPRLASFIARKCGGVRRFVAEYLAES